MWQAASGAGRLIPYKEWHHTLCQSRIAVSKPDCMLVWFAGALQEQLQLQLRLPYGQARLYQWGVRRSQGKMTCSAATVSWKTVLTHMGPACS